MEYALLIIIPVNNPLSEFIVVENQSSEPYRVMKIINGNDSFNLPLHLY